MQEPYATLSHCWGSTSPIQTTSQNIRHFILEGISRKDLPKTFNEAIDVVRSLGMRYLWIDALCIVQDSMEDWLHEADLMSKVYRYCFINIAATASESSKGGLYRTRNPQAVRCTELTIQWRSRRNTNFATYTVVPEPRIWRQNLAKEPMNTRGWVVQERILSPRTLHFGSKQLFWECREHVTCETFHRGLPASLRNDSFIDIKALELGDETQDDRWPAVHISQDGGTSTTLMGRVWKSIAEEFRPIIRQEVTLYATKRSAAVFRDWDTVIELYSAGELSYVRDKLVAVSGIAGAIAQGAANFQEDNYLAGLWQSSLPCHLLWTTGDVNVARKGIWQPKVPRRITDGGPYIAPSWSWASISGKISFEWCQRDFDKVEYLASIESVAVIHEGASRSRFGQVTSGQLTICAPVASCRWTSEDTTPSIRSLRAYGRRFFAFRQFKISFQQHLRARQLAILLLSNAIYYINKV